MDIMVDNQGNVYVAGYTSGSLFGHQPAGGGDAVVAKLDSDGNLVWGKQLDR